MLRSSTLLSQTPRWVFAVWGLLVLLNFLVQSRWARGGLLVINVILVPLGLVAQRRLRTGAGPPPPELPPIDFAPKRSRASRRQHSTEAVTGETIHEQQRSSYERERQQQQQQEQEFLFNKYPHVRPEVILDTLRNVCGEMTAAMAFIEQHFPMRSEQVCAVLKNQPAPGEFS